MGTYGGTGGTEYYKSSKQQQLEILTSNYLHIQRQYGDLSSDCNFLKQQLMNQIRETNEAKKKEKKIQEKYKKLKKKYRQLQSEVHYVPGREGAIEAQKEFETLKLEQE